MLLYKDVVVRNNKINVIKKLKFKIKIVYLVRTFQVMNFLVVIQDVLSLNKVIQNV